MSEELAGEMRELQQRPVARGSGLHGEDAAYAREHGEQVTLGRHSILTSSWWVAAGFLAYTIGLTAISFYPRAHYSTGLLTTLWAIDLVALAIAALLPANENRTRAGGTNS